MLVKGLIVIVLEARRGTRARRSVATFASFPTLSFSQCGISLYIWLRYLKRDNL